jgi:hypothetical protein
MASLSSVGTTWFRCPMGRSAGSEHMEGAEHSLHSSQREALLEHLFSGEVMRQLWLLGIFNLEVLKPEVDYSGYDLVFETGPIVRHVQLKSTQQAQASDRPRTPTR